MGKRSHPSQLPVEIDNQLNLPKAWILYETREIKLVVLLCLLDAVNAFRHCHCLLSP